MAPRKRRTPSRKGGLKKKEGKPAARKHAAPKAAAKPGIGHNRPPEPPVLPHKPLPHMSWHTQDDGGWMRDHQAARQRAHAVAMSSMSVGPVAPPHVLRSEDLYNEMRRRIAALEETLAKLPAVPGAPLDDNEIEEIKREIAKLKTLPPAPAHPPSEAVAAQSKLAKFGEKILVALATEAVSEGAKALWANYGNELIALARAVCEWIASLPPPPL
jgi:hypothetical protein